MVFPITTASGSCLHTREGMVRYLSKRNKKTKQRVKGVLSYSVFLLALVGCQLYHSYGVFDRINLQIDGTLYLKKRLEKENSRHDVTSQNSTRSQLPMGACIMVKDDNDLLYEWLAYHFTTLIHPGQSLYVVVGSDIESVQDPAILLSRWRNVTAGTLRYWLLQPDQFINRHGDYISLFGGIDNATRMTSDNLKKHHHHALIHRQKGFITACSQLLQHEGAGWTIFTDTDEFLTLQPLSLDDNVLTIDGMGHDSITNTSYQVRKMLSNSTFAEKSLLSILDTLHKTGNDIGECYTIPRLLVGALENRTCPDHQPTITGIQNLAQRQMRDRYAYMSTLRFFQHATKGDFARSKFGKVIMDLSRIPESIIKTSIPRNIHRPYPQYCGPASRAHFPDSYFFLMHYIGSWERYSSRSDERRNRREWEERAYMDASISACTSNIVSWYPRFVQRVGQKMAYGLLGVTAPH